MNTFSYCEHKMMITKIWVDLISTQDESDWRDNNVCDNVLKISRTRGILQKEN